MIGYLGFRLSRSHRELGTEAEHASYNTLHLAALAGSHLRSGLQPLGASKSIKYLHALLGCDALALSDSERMLAWAGPEISGGARDPIRELNRKTLASGRRQVYRLAGTGALESAGLVAAVVVPIRVAERVVGSLTALSMAGRSVNSGASAGLVRASDEVADWVAAQDSACGTCCFTHATSRG
nr:hypothetical protein [Renibacterium salmoninarum]